MKRATLSSVLALSFVLVGCGGKADQKGVEAPMPAMDGKSDTWWAPTIHGDIRWGENDQGLFDGTMKFHAWDFQLSEGSFGSAVTLTTTPIDDNVDTVMYLYHWNLDSKSWGKYVARNDDHAGKIGSQISKKLDGGLYRAVVKGYKDKVRGSFNMVGSCEGNGCPAAVAVNGLDTQQEASIVDALDVLCGDTYCGGDYDWRTVSVSCVWGSGCTLALDAQSFYPEDAIALDWLDRFKADQLQGAGQFSSGKGAYAVTLERTVDRASDGVWIRVSCELGAPFMGYSDLISGSSPGEPTQIFSDDIMDCVGTAETLLAGIVPSSFAP